MAFSDRLSRLRREHGFSQEQLAELIGATRQEVIGWELGLAQPELDKVNRLARVLGCKPEELLPEAPTEEYPYRAKAVIHYTTPIRERKSGLCLFGVPLFHIGKRARGIFAMGTDAAGVIAIGVKAKGLLSAGVLSMGVLSFGVFSFGAVAFGAVAFGVAALGAVALGLLAIGAICLGIISVGAVAIGGFSAGALALGHYFAAGDVARGLIALGSSEAVGSLFRSTAALSEIELQYVRALLERTVPAALQWASRIIQAFL